MRGLAATLARWGWPAMAALGLHGATIRGTVVENASGHPLARATVVVAALGENPATRGSPEAIEWRRERDRSVVTNPSGIFEFSSLPAGTYRISASKLEFVRVLYGQKRWYAPGMPIVLAADDEASLTIRMQRYGAITGALLDENEVGLPAHELAVYTNTRPPKLLARSATDDRGMYRFFNLYPGSYLVRSLAKQYEDESYLPTFYLDSPVVDPHHAVPVKLDEEVSHVDFHAATGRLFTVSGRVGRAYVQPMVTLSSDTGTETASVDGNGNFTFNPMAPGTYELLAEVPSNRLLGRTASFRVLTVDRDLSDLRIVTGPLPTVQVTFEDTNGRPVMMPEGKLLARPKNPAGEGTPQDIPSAATLLPGRWEVALRPDTSYCVVGFRAASQESAADGRVDGWNEILLAPDSQNAVKFVLSTSPATIGGTVKNASGDAVAGVRVFVEAYDLDPFKRIEPMRSVAADSKGQYSFGGLAPGIYRLLASFDYASAPSSDQMEEAQALKITVEAGARVTVDLEEFVIR